MKYRSPCLLILNLHAKWVLVALIISSSYCIADDRVIQEVVRGFEKRVTQDLLSVEKDFLLNDWKSSRPFVILGLQGEEENARRICAQVIEASKDTSVVSELVAAYAIESNEEVKKYIVYALSACSPPKRVVSYAFQEFQRERLSGIKVAWCVVLIKNGHEDSKMCWDYLVEGLKPDNDNSGSKIHRLAYIHRLRETCKGLPRLGLDAKRIIPALDRLSMDLSLGVETKADIEYATKVIENLKK